MGKELQSRSFGAGGGLPCSRPQLPSFLSSSEAALCSGRGHRAMGTGATPAQFMDVLAEMQPLQLETYGDSGQHREI